jgi:hypothetical protein
MEISDVHFLQANRIFFEVVGHRFFISHDILLKKIVLLIFRKKVAAPLLAIDSDCGAREVHHTGWSLYRLRIFFQLRHLVTMARSSDPLSISSNFWNCMQWPAVEMAWYRGGN